MSGPARLCAAPGAAGAFARALPPWGGREAAIMAWLGEDIETTALFQLQLASG